MRASQLCLIGFGLLVSSSAIAAFDLDLPPINYSTTAASDRVAMLFAEAKEWKSALEWDDECGYLPSLLKKLEIPLSSQVLVFSKTSLQRARIGPKTPRAIYFNDEVSVGYCQRGQVLEIAAADSRLGMVFYTVDQDAGRAARLSRQTDSCLICHGSSSNQGFPGYLVRSVFADNTGELVLSRGSKRVDHTTPLADRWGGWYVTGKSGRQTHLGNRLFAARSGEPLGDEGSNVIDLHPYFTVDNHLTPHSDLVALMVLEHQGEAYNRLTRANFLVRMAENEQAEINKALGRPPDERSDSITRRIQSACEPLVQYLLFCDEARLQEPVSGTSSFTKDFVARGPFDSQGRSLREFDLKTRMFRYPLSYLIYSRAFDSLPTEAKQRVYRRLWEVLSGQDQSKPFAHLTASDRLAIRQIVGETKKDLPAFWK